MRSRIGRIVAIAALVAAVASPGYAQISQGRLAGTVTDAQGAVLPGVTVTATSPSLIGQRTTVTQADGTYLFPGMPSGVYKLAFELSGFKPYERDNLAVTLGQTISFDAKLEVGGLTERITVTGASPLVDTSTTKIGTSLKGDELIAVPNSTDVWAALAEAPGVRMQGFDVGGSHKSQQSGYESFGIQNQARVVSDGIDHTEGVGGTGFYEDYYANEEVSIGALGADVEMNSGGAAIVTTIKSGGNEFKGLYHVSYEPGSFVGSNAEPRDMAEKGYSCPNNALGLPQCDNPNLLFWEAHVDLGGRIVRDKVWFYGAYNHFKIDKLVSGQPEQFSDLGIFDNYTGKATWKPGQNDTIIGYYQQGRKQKPRRGISALLPAESVRAQDSMSRMYKGEWQKVLTDRTFFNVNVGNFTLDWPMVVAGRSGDQRAEAVPHHHGGGRRRLERLLDLPQEAAGQGPAHLLPAREGRQPRLQVRVREHPRLVPLRPQRHVGRHPLLLPLRRHARARRIGSASSTPASASDYGSGWTVGAEHRHALRRLPPGSLGAEQQADLHHGLRFDYQEVGYEDATRKPVFTDVLADGTRIFPTSTDVTGADDPLQHATSRRGSAPPGTSRARARSVLKAFYGRYYNNLADGFSAINPGGQSIAEYNFLDQNRNQRYDGPSELGHAAPARRRRQHAGRSRLQDAVHRRDQRVARVPAAR